MRILFITLFICLSAQASIKCVEDFVEHGKDLYSRYPLTIIPLMKNVKLIKILSGAEVLGTRELVIRKSKSLKENGKDVVIAGKVIPGSFGRELKDLGRDIQDFASDLREIATSFDDTQNIIEFGNLVISKAGKLKKFSKEVFKIGDKLGLYDVKKLGKEGEKLSKQAMEIGSDIIFLGEQLDQSSDLKSFTHYTNRKIKGSPLDFKQVAKFIYNSKNKLCDGSSVSKYKSKRYKRTEKTKFRLVNRRELRKFILSIVTP